MGTPAVIHSIKGSIFPINMAEMQHDKKKDAEKEKNTATLSKISNAIKGSDSYSQLGPCNNCCWKCKWPTGLCKSIRNSSKNSRTRVNHSSTPSTRQPRHPLPVGEHHHTPCSHRGPAWHNPAASHFEVPFYNLQHKCNCRWIWTFFPPSPNANRRKCRDYFSYGPRIFT